MNKFENYFPDDDDYYEDIKAENIFFLQKFIERKNKILDKLKGKTIKEQIVGKDRAHLLKNNITMQI